MEGTAMWAYRWFSTLLGIPLFISTFLNYYNRFGVGEEQRFVYVMDQVLGELTGLASFSILEAVLCLGAGLGCLAIWVPLGRLPNVLGLLVGTGYFAFLTQYAHYANLSDQLLAFGGMGVVYALASIWGIVGMRMLNSHLRYPFLVGVGIVAIGLVGVSVLMALRAPYMDQMFSDYRHFMELTGLESAEEMGKTKATPE